MPPAVLIPAAIVGAGAVATTAVGLSQQKKAQSDAKNAAQAEEQRAQAEQARLEEKYGTLTPEEQAQEQANFELAKKRQAEYERRAGMTGEQLIGEEGSVNQDLINTIRSRQGMTGEELFAGEGELNRKIGQEALSDDPYAMLAPELELARMAVNQEANRRGVFSGQPEGGIRFEQLGRANVDLAVKAAAQRIAQRNALASSYLTLGGNARSEAGTLAERSLGTKERARLELQNFLQSQQGLTESQKGRTTGAGFNASNVGESGTARGYDTQQDLFGYKAGQGAALAESGLGTIGRMVAGDAFVPPNLTSAGSGDKGTGLTSLRGEDYDPLYGLASLSGKGVPIG